MKKLILLSFNILFSLSISFGQGTIRGKVNDETGQPIIGASIILKSNRSYGTITDLDGNYSLKINDSTAQTIIISFVSYSSVEEIVHPVKNEVLIKNYFLVPVSQGIKEVEITAKAVRAKEYYTELIKKKSAVTLDYISSETIKKTGDNNVVAAISRVSGVSTNGSFITVRGIGDRYVKTAINGLRIPTLDPFTNNIKLDLFPSSLIDNIFISKTASPDLPGDWAGAYISVETKDYPENLSVNVETTFGYNEQSTFKNVISSERSTTDWLGYDNSLRVHNHYEFVNANINPNQYQQFVALGLGPYYNSLGITEQNWGEGSAKGETYFKLGLVQIGLLPPAKINDNDAYLDAKNQYFQNTYKSQAFELINANVPKSGKSFPDNWNTTSRNAPVNFSQSFSIGNQTKLFNKQFGYILGFRYGSSIFYDPNSSAQRASVVGDGSASGNLVKSITSSVNEQSSIESNGWSALVNLAYKFNTNNSISFLFMPNIYGVNKVRKSVDYYSEPHTLKTTNTQFYEQRKQLVYQLKSEHYLAGPKIKIEFNTSYTNGKSSAPDFKNIYFKRDSATYTSYQIGPTVDQGIHRYYRYLSDDLFDSHLSVEFPFGDKPGLVRKLKIGGAFQSNNKKSDQYDYSLNFGPYAPIMQNDDLNQFLSLDNFEISRGTNNGLPYSTINMYYSEDGSPANHTFGNSTLSAMFVMLDYSFNPTLRFSGGLRVENASIKTDVVLYDSLGYKKNDPRRDYRPGFPEANPGELNEISLLPSTNLIIKLRDDELSTTNLRINYSKTVARPSIRELSDIAIFDYEYRAFVYGNSDLKMVQINNYDLRIESYFKSGDNISMSLFYKEFKNHIELVNSGGYSWQNVDKSNVSGIELEGKKKISSHFELSANITLIHSTTNFIRKRLEISNGIKNFIPLDEVKRTMFGQAPYVLNGILSYSSDSIGLSLALSYNLQGARLVIASDKKEVPDIFELPRNLLDFKVAKKVGKNFSVSLKVRNILNTPVVRTYKDWNIVYDKYTYGTIYEFGILFKI